MSRRDEILDALIEIFRTEGLGSDFTIKELADKVHIGKSTIYEYFKTKDEILQEAVCRVVDTSIEEIKSATLVDGTFEDQVRAEFIRLFNIAKNSRFLFTLASPHNKMVPADPDKNLKDKVKSIQGLYQERFGQIFMKGVEEGVLKPDILLDNVLIIYSLVTGSILTLANSNLEISENVDIDQYIDKVYSTIIKVAN